MNETELQTLAAFLTVAADCVAGASDFTIPSTQICTIRCNLATKSPELIAAMETITKVVEEALAS